MSDFKFGEAVENIAASPDNPIKYGKFVRYVTDSYTSKYKIRHSTHYAQYRADGNGKLYKTPPENLRKVS